MRTKAKILFYKRFFFFKPNQISWRLKYLASEGDILTCNRPLIVGLGKEVLLENYNWTERSFSIHSDPRDKPFMFPDGEMQYWDEIDVIDRISNHLSNLDSSAFAKIWHLPWKMHVLLQCLDKRKWKILNSRSKFGRLNINIRKWENKIIRLPLIGLLVVVGLVVKNVEKCLVISFQFYLGEM